MSKKSRGPFAVSGVEGRWVRAAFVFGIALSSMTTTAEAAPCPEPSPEKPSSAMKAEPGCEEGSVLDEAIREANEEAGAPPRESRPDEDSGEGSGSAKARKPPSGAPPSEEQRRRQALERQREKLGAELERQQRQEQRQRDLKRLRALPRAELHVVSQPPGAEIIIDGDGVQCTTPCQVTGLLAEDHTVELRLRGHVPSSHDVFLKPGTRDELTMQLEQTPPRFRVKSRCAGDAVTVYVDGAPAGENKLDGELAYTAGAGRHVVRLEARNCRTREQSLELTAGQEAHDWPVIGEDLQPTLAGLLRTWQGPATHKEKWAMSAAFELSTYATGVLPGFAITPVEVGTDYFRFMIDGGYAKGKIAQTTVGSARVGSRMALRIPLAYGALLVGNGVGYRYYYGGGASKHSLELPFWGGVEIDPICGLSFTMTGGYSIAPLFIDSAQFTVGIGYAPNARCTPEKTRAAAPNQPANAVEVKP